MPKGKLMNHRKYSILPSTSTNQMPLSSTVCSPGSYTLKKVILYQRRTKEGQYNQLGERTAGN